MKASNQVSLYLKGTWQLGAVSVGSIDYKQILLVINSVDKAIEKARKA